MRQPSLSVHMNWWLGAGCSLLLLLTSSLLASPNTAGVLPPPGKRLYRVVKKPTAPLPGKVVISAAAQKLPPPEAGVLYFRDPEWQVAAPPKAAGVAVPQEKLVARTAHNGSLVRLPALQVKGRSKQPRVPISAAWLPLERVSEELGSSFVDGLRLEGQPEF